MHAKENEVRVWGRNLKSLEVKGGKQTTSYITGPYRNPNAAGLYFMRRKDLSTKL
jgi:hypothetical protein